MESSFKNINFYEELGKLEVQYKGIVRKKIESLQDKNVELKDMIHALIGEMESEFKTNHTFDLIKQAKKLIQ